MKISCIIVENEPLAMERIKTYVEKLPFLNLLACFETGIDALVFLKTAQVDLIFLDINLGEISGIQFLEAGKIKSKVIVTTAYEEYALKGYELNVTDYLLKPFSFERFFQAVSKVQDEVDRQMNKTDIRYIFIKTEYRLEKIMLNEILFIEGMRDYRRIHTTNKRIMTLQTFKDLEIEIPENIICRVHKSYMVAIDKIESIEKDEIKIDGIYIPVSETYKKRFYELL
ncbi:MAG: response regulator transcription factor [Bacteroidetes bacterium]|nr:response regulator transcription factor [Bacteroidota bacterium]MBK9412672.1 response regulator transcription factor [Bacteroidota bacterium]MBP6658837.1 response regulator transcription factor [Bacteroidia bacterium]